MPTIVEILSAGAVKPGVIPLLAAFERDTGYQAALEFATAPAIRKRLDSRQAPDIVIAPPDVLDELTRPNQATPAHVLLGRIGVGLMVRQGAAIPKIASVDEFSQSLLGADSIVYNQASTGIYLDKLFDRLGVVERLANKTTRCVDFAAVLDHVRNSLGNEIGFGATTVISENAGKGVQWVGPLPAEIQNYTSYAAALTGRGVDVTAARALLEYIAAPAAKAVFTAAGIM